MEKGSSSTSANASESTMQGQADVPMTSFQLFGRTVSVPVASMATETLAVAAPATLTLAQPAVSESGSFSTVPPSVNNSGSGQGQANTPLSFQPFRLHPTPPAPVFTSNMVRGMTGPATLTATASAAAAVAAPAIPSMEAVTNALAARRQQVAARRSSALLNHLRRCAEALVAATTTQRRKAVDAELMAISRLASSEGDATQRLAAAFGEALARAAILPWKGVTSALFLYSDGGVPCPRDAIFARQNFLNTCPLLRLAAVATNELILEAMQDECMIHVVDLGGVFYGQWLELIRALAYRRQDRPHLRLTVVQENLVFLTPATKLLTEEAKRLRLPFEVHPVESSVEALDLKALGIIPGDHHALAIIATLQLHRLVGTATGTNTSAASASNDGENRRWMGGGVHASPLSEAMWTRAHTFLRRLRELAPKVMITTEQHASHFVPSFVQRFASALDYYEQLFGSMEDATAMCSATDRKVVERCVLKEEIKDIIACEGGPRWARHELMARWIVRMGAAGFVLSRMSDDTAERVWAEAQHLPAGVGRDAGRRYGVVDGGGWFVISRNDKPMFVVSAWKKTRMVSMG